LLAWPCNLSSAVSSCGYIRICSVSLPYFKTQNYTAIYIEVIDEIVKDTMIRHAFDLSHNFKKKKNSCLSNTSSAAAEVILHQMSDEGDPE
jgi:hypothetical protein